MLFAPDPTLYLKLAEWFVLERLCCPFLTLGAVIAPDGIWAELTGSPAVKPFLVAELGLSET